MSNTQTLLPWLIWTAQNLKSSANKSMSKLSSSPTNVRIPLHLKNHKHEANRPTADWRNYSFGSDAMFSHKQNNTIETQSDLWLLICPVGSQISFVSLVFCSSAISSPHLLSLSCSSTYSMRHQKGLNCRVETWRRPRVLELCECVTLCHSLCIRTSAKLPSSGSVIVLMLLLSSAFCYRKGPRQTLINCRLTLECRSDSTCRCFLSPKTCLVYSQTCAALTLLFMKALRHWTTLCWFLLSIFSCLKTRDSNEERLEFNVHQQGCIVCVNTDRGSEGKCKSHSGNNTDDRK